MDFYCVYIQEAHPDDGWQVLTNLRERIVFNQPKTIDERAAAAEACVLHMQLEMPTLLDGISNEVDSAYSALPERLYVIDPDGRIVWRTGPGPWNFLPDAWEKAIRERVSRVGEPG